MKIILKTWLKLRVSWSNLKNKGDIINISVDDSDKLNTKALYSSLKKAAANVYLKYTWTQDTFTDLFDCMRTPARCYSDYKQGKLNDDCDGFHACIMHLCNEANIDCVLLTYMVPNINQCHTIAVAKSKTGVYYKIDYESVNRYDSIEELVNHIKIIHPDLIDYNMVKFDTKYYVVKDF